MLLFNAANSVLIPPLRVRRMPIATHVDGLEWRRAKWGKAGRRYYRMAEALSVRWSTALIADAQGISDYYEAEFGAETVLIRYGAPLIDPAPAELLDPARRRAGPVPPRGGADRAREPRPRHRRGVRPERCHRSARGGRFGPVRRRVHREHPRPRRRPGPLRRRALGPGPAERAVLQRAHLPPRSLGRRHQPVAAACHRRRGGHGGVRRVVQPRGARRRRRLLAHARPTSRAASSAPRPTVRAPPSGAPGRASAPRPTTGTTSPTATSRCADRW